MSQEPSQRAWAPDRSVADVVRQQIDHRRIHWVRWAEAERARQAHAAAETGTIRTGGFMHRLVTTAETAVLSFGREILADTRETLSEMYGSIPAQAGAWISATVLTPVQAMTIQLGNELDSHARRNRHHPEPSADSAFYFLQLQTLAQVFERELAISLGKLQARAVLSSLTPPSRPDTFQTDVFICHASLDKPTVAAPIAAELERRGYTVWLDRAMLTLGDTLLTKIDEGLANCRYGVVVLSPSFFVRKWPRRELAGLAARQDAEDRKVVLPVWHGVNEADITRLSPLLGSLIGVSTDQGITAVVDEIEIVLLQPSSAKGE